MQKQDFISRLVESIDAGDVDYYMNAAANRVTVPLNEYETFIVLVLTFKNSCDLKFLSKFPEHVRDDALSVVSRAVCLFLADVFGTGCIGEDIADITDAVVYEFFLYLS